MASSNDAAEMPAEKAIDVVFMDEESPRKVRLPCLAGKWRTLLMSALVAVLATGAVVIGVFAVSQSGEGDLPPQLLKVPVPQWSPGLTLNYTVWTADGASSPKLVSVVNVGIRDDGHYMLASEKYEHALQHAVLNYFPFFGRITVDSLAVFENGVPQALFGTWPLHVPGDAGAEAGWEFTLFGTNWKARVVRYDRSGAGNVHFQAREVNATHDSAAELTYVLDLAAGFLSALKFVDSVGVKQLEIALAAYASQSGFVGDAYFIRASDLFDAKWTHDTSGSQADEAEVLVGQHRSGTPWDMLVYVADVAVDCKGNSTAELKLTGQSSGQTAVGLHWEPCQTAREQVGTVQHFDTKYNVQANVQGEGTRAWLRIAGAIIYKYSLP